MMLSLLFSHGSLGASVGHGGQNGHDHATSTHDHDAPELVVGEADGSDIDVQKGANSVGHAHMTVDGLMDGSFDQVTVRIPSARIFMRSQQALRSAAVAPLLEPPSA